MSTTPRDLLLAMADHAERMGPPKATEIGRLIGKTVRQLERVPGIKHYMVPHYGGGNATHIEAKGIRLAADAYYPKEPQ